MTDGAVAKRVTVRQLDVQQFIFQLMHTTLKNAELLKHHWGDPYADGRIILRWIFRKWEGVVGTGLSWLRIGIGGGHL